MIHEHDIPRVELRRPHWGARALGVTVVLVLALARHVWYVDYWAHYRLLTVLWTVTFIAVGVQWLLSWLERPYTVTPEQQARLDRLKVTVAVPVYNEDPEIVDRTLYSILTQVRLPNRVQVVDDGSDVDYSEVRDWWEAHHSLLVDFSWVRKANGGKKSAHARTFRGDNADVFITVDSDTALESYAIEEGLKPFADPRVQSVAGIELAANHAQNLLVRLKSVNTLVWQFITWSSVRNVWRIRYLSMRSWGWWFTVLPTWWFFAFVALLGAIIVDWRHAHGFAISMLYVGAAWGWVVATRMFAIRRSDQRWLDRMEAFFLVPFAMAWMTVVLRPIRLYGIATCFNQGWNTRAAKVEIVSA